MLLRQETMYRNREGRKWGQTNSLFLFVGFFLVVKTSSNQGIHILAFTSPVTKENPANLRMADESTSPRWWSSLHPATTTILCPRLLVQSNKHTLLEARSGIDNDNDESSTEKLLSYSKTRADKDLGGYDPFEDFGSSEKLNVGDPQIKLKEKERSVTSILKELAAIQQQGPQKYCMLGTRHCSFLHQQIIELLAFALVLSGNHVYTSGAGGTHAATIRGALRAERPDLLTVVLPQSMSKQTQESQELLAKVDDVIAMPQNDDLSLDVASRICNSYLLSCTDQLISFAFHESTTVIEATKEAKKLGMLVTVLYLD